MFAVDIPHRYNQGQNVNGTNYFELLRDKELFLSIHIMCVCVISDTQLSSSSRLYLSVVN